MSVYILVIEKFISAIIMLLYMGVLIQDYLVCYGQNVSAVILCSLLWVSVTG